jgi:membrane dipeptidase
VACAFGVIGMSAAPHTTLSAARPQHSIESVMDHFRCCVDLVGIDHVAFGPDTLYGDHVQLHRTFGHLLRLGAARGPDFEPVACVDGMENPTENFTNICGWLVRHGFDDDAIRAVIEGGRLPGPAGRLGQPLTGSGMGAAGAGIPRLSDKDLTVKV